MAEDDDDDGFGEFTFASSINNNSPHYPHPSLPPITSFEFPINIATTTSTVGLPSAVHDNGKDDDDDDEWGDFVETPLGSVASSHAPSSKAFDPFDFSSSNPPFQSESIKNAGTDSTKHFDSHKTNTVATPQWVKPKGAIPLSIFGGFDDETEDERSGVVDPHDYNGKDSRNVGNVDDQSKLSNAFENTQLNGQSGFGSTNLSSKINGTSLGGIEPVFGIGTVVFDLCSVENRNNSNTSVEHFNGDERVRFENGRNSSSKDTNLTSSLDVLNADFIGQSVGSNQLDTVLSSNSDKWSSSVLDGNQVNEGPNPHSNSVGLSFRKENSLNIDSWGLDFSGFQSNLVTTSSSINKPSSYNDVPILNSNFGGKSQELHFSGDNEADDDEDDGWEFKEALSESIVNHGNVQVQSEGQQQLSNAKTGGFLVVSNGSADMHPLSDTSFGSFAFSNGISSSRGDIFGLHSNSNAASDIGVFSNNSLTYEQTNGGNGLAPAKEIEISEADDFFGDFATAWANAEPKPKAGLKLHESADVNMPSSEFVNGVNGAINLFSMSNGSADLFFQVNGISNSTDKESVEFHTEPVLPENEVDDNYNMYTNSRKHVYGENADDGHLVAGSNTPEPDFGEFTFAPANISQTKEGMEIREKIFSTALPLSVFGDKESEMDDSLSIADDFLNQHGSFKRNDRSVNSNVPINDLISQLYKQAEKASSVDVNPSQSVLIPSDSIMNANIIESANEVCGISWGNEEFSFENSAPIQSHPVPNGALSESIPPESKLGVYLDFYSNLSDELCQIAKCHPQMLKEAESSSIFSGKDAKAGIRIEEIQEAGTGSDQNNAVAREHIVDNLEGMSFNLDRFVEHLRKPELHVFELQYDLERRLSMVGSDIKSATELMEHVKTMLKILSFESLENILTYVSIWSEMINACALELQHGAQILRESLERNIQSQLLADVRGKRFVIGLCEVYRVVVVIGASTKLYKPWIFLSPESSSSMLSSRLEECHELWNSLSIKEAIFGDTSIETGLGKDIVVLLDSIKFTNDLDAIALEKHVLTHPESLCRFSLLTPAVAPGITKVTWENEQCFVKVANLWANLISPDFPKLSLQH